MRSTCSKIGGEPAHHAAGAGVGHSPVPSNGPRVVLTAFGQPIYPRVTALIHNAEQLADDMRAWFGNPNRAEMNFGC